MNHHALHPRASLGHVRLREAARGFTLIELLTVIAIVGILAAIIIPVVGKVRQSALRSDCVANLRQVGSAVTLYAQDNKGFYPRAYALPGGVELYWRELLARGGYFGRPNLPMAANRPQETWHGSHYTFMTCKAHRQKVPISSPSDEWLRPTYSMNGTLASGQPTAWRPRIESFSAPSRLMYVADGPFPSGGARGDAPNGIVLNAALWAGAWRPDATSKYAPHGSVANILFFDGHVEARSADKIPLNSTGSAENSIFWNGK
jgi:prepilin-type N-terminal cleavage/methylation domain-containing protein/prepilin-type processing-associated H-X9-DG protein